MTITTQSFAILLVEDEAADAHLVKAALREHRILAELHRVADGREAMDFLQRKGERFASVPRPDLILLDLNMPRMDGREFLTAVKGAVVNHGGGNLVLARKGQTRRMGLVGQHQNDLDRIGRITGRSHQCLHVGTAA